MEGGRGERRERRREGNEGGMSEGERAMERIQGSRKNGDVADGRTSVLRKSLVKAWACLWFSHFRRNESTLLLMDTFTSTRKKWCVEL